MLKIRIKIGPNAAVLFRLSAAIYNKKSYYVEVSRIRNSRPFNILYSPSENAKKSLQNEAQRVDSVFATSAICDKKVNYLPGDSSSELETF